jgi:transcriptional regulator with XRE-family HTH domain
MSPKSIKKTRKTLKLTQRAAAALVHVSPNTWARWERGESRPRGLHQRKAIASLPLLATSAERPNPSKLNSARVVSGVPSKPWSTGATWLKFAGTWAGNDAEKLLKEVYALRSEAEF